MASQIQDKTFMQGNDATSIDDPLALVAETLKVAVSVKPTEKYHRLYAHLNLEPQIVTLKHGEVLHTIRQLSPQCNTTTVINSTIRTMPLCFDLQYADIR